MASTVWRRLKSPVVVLSGAATTTEDGSSVTTLGVGLLTSSLRAGGGGEAAIGDLSPPWRWSGEVSEAILALALAFTLALVFFSMARDDEGNERIENRVKGRIIQEARDHYCWVVSFFLGLWMYL